MRPRASGQGGPHRQGAGAPSRAPRVLFLGTIPAGSPCTSQPPPPHWGLGEPGVRLVTPVPSVPPLALTYLSRKERGQEGKGPAGSSTG